MVKRWGPIMNQVLFSGWHHFAGTVRFARLPAAQVFHDPINTHILQLISVYTFVCPFGSFVGPPPGLSLSLL
jgi:hypothetical protein